MRKPLLCWIGFHKMRYYLGTKWMQCQKCGEMHKRIYPYNDPEMHELERRVFPEQCEEDRLLVRDLLEKMK